MYQKQNVYEGQLLSSPKDKKCFFVLRNNLTFSSTISHRRFFVHNNTPCWVKHSQVNNVKFCWKLRKKKEQFKLHYRLMMLIQAWELRFARVRGWGWVNRYGLVVNKTYFSGSRIETYFQLHTTLNGLAIQASSEGVEVIWLSLSFCMCVLVCVRQRDSKSFLEEEKSFHPIPLAQWSVQYK